MRIFNNKNKIINEGIVVKGKITKIKILYWLTVNKKPIRITNSQSSHPYMVYFKYTVNGAEYYGKSYLSWCSDKLHVDEEIKVYVDKNNPKKYAINL